MSKKEKYSVHFLTGAFFLKEEEVRDDVIIATPVLSKNHEEVHCFESNTEEINELFNSENGIIAKKLIEDEDFIFDFMVVTNKNEGTASYYINTTNGLENCG